MATIQSTLRLQDNMSKTLSKVHKGLVKTGNAMDNVAKKATTFNNTATAFTNTGNSADNASKKVNNLKNKLNETAKTPSGLEKLNGVLNKLISGYALLKVVQTSDDISGSKARLGLVAEQYAKLNAEVGLTGESADTMADKIYGAAQRSRASYATMMDSVAKLGLQTRGVFSSTDEIIRFSEILNKSFIGATPEGQAAAVMQLTQALSSGRLQGDEFVTIRENAQLLNQAIEDYMRNTLKVKGTMKEWAAEGLLTADVIKAAIFSASDDIEKRFESLPMTWGQVWTNVVNKIIRVTQPLLNLISWVAQHWATIEPIVIGVAAAVGLYAGALLIFNVQQGISNMLKTKGIISAVAHGAAITAEMTATTGMTAAQIGFNAALYACPLTWILLIIIAVIAVVYAVVAAINSVTKSTISAGGIIMGVVTVVGAFLWNTIFGLIDLILGAVNYIANPWIAFANFFGNLFNDPIGAIIHLFGDLADNVLGVVETIASAIDKVFGSNLAGTVQGWRSGLNTMVEDAANQYGNGSYEKIMDNLDLSSESLGLSRWDYGEAWDKGYAFGEGIDKKISSAFGGEDNDLIGTDGAGGKALKTTSNDNLLSDEDIKLLLDVATRDYKLNYQQITPNITMTFGDIRETANVDDVMDALADRIEEVYDANLEVVQ